MNNILPREEVLNRHKDTTTELLVHPTLLTRPLNPSKTHHRSRIPHTARPTLLSPPPSPHPPVNSISHATQTLQTNNSKPCPPPHPRPYSSNPAPRPDPSAPPSHPSPIAAMHTSITPRRSKLKDHAGRAQLREVLGRRAERWGWGWGIWRERGGGREGSEDERKWRAFWTSGLLFHNGF